MWRLCILCITNISKTGNENRSVQDLKKKLQILIVTWFFVLKVRSHRANIRWRRNISLMIVSFRSEFWLNQLRMNLHVKWISYWLSLNLKKSLGLITFLFDHIILTIFIVLPMGLISTLVNANMEAISRSPCMNASLLLRFQRSYDNKYV